MDRRYLIGLIKYAATGSSPAGSCVPPHFCLQTEKQTLSAALGYLSSSYSSLLFAIIDGLFLCYYYYYFSNLKEEILAGNSDAAIP